MRAAVYHGPGDVRIEEVPRPELTAPTDALVRITHTAICGSDLWFYRGASDRDPGTRVGHEPMGVVEAVGDDVRRVAPGDRVFAPFVVSCGRCEFCRRGLHTSCVRGESWADNGGAQSEYVRAPHADGTLVRVPDRYADDEDALRSVLPLTDVMGTGHHAARSAGVGPGDSCVVVGDGAVGLCAVLAARRLGARRIVAVGHHRDRLDLATDLGATDTVLGGEGDDGGGPDGDEGGGDDDTDDSDADRVIDLLDGGADHVMECVGAAAAMETAVEVCRPGGTVGYVGVPHGVDEAGMELGPLFSDNVTLRGGVAPVRAYADELLADVLGGTLDPAPVFTETVDLAGVPEGYRAMDEREALKVLVRVGD